MLARLQRLVTEIADVRQLREHLQVAIELEHSTIPPYLCALYSIQDGRNRASAGVIRSVVMEEMLHLTLAANVLNAIGGRPDLNRPRFVPSYPMRLPDISRPFEVGLHPFSPGAIETFMNIEMPSGRLRGRVRERSAGRAAPGYTTIDEFYASIMRGLERLAKNTRRLFDGDRRRQIGKGHFYGGGGESIEVVDLATARAALRVIVEQGEGSASSIDDDDDTYFGEPRQVAHYFRFKQIHAGRYLRPIDTPASQPTGDLFPVDWNAVYPMRADPRVDDYPPGTDLRRISDDFNRTYADLLASLHHAFNGAPNKLRESVATMYALKYKAVALMRVPFGPDGRTAGPTFEYVDTRASRKSA